MKEPSQWTAAMENKKRPILIQAGASWCNPCQVLKPMITKAVIERDGALEYLYIDIDQWKELAQMLQIQHVPICFLVKDGALVDQLQGVPESQDKIDSFIEKAFVEGPAK